MAYRPTFAAAAALFILTPAATAQDEGPAPGSASNHELQLLYNGSVLGQRLMKADVSASVADGDYESRAIFRTAGLAGFFKQAEITATVNGTYAGNGVEPIHFQHRNSASSKNRQIQIDWTADDVIPTVTPPFGSMGQPPATLEERLGSRDVASTILSMTLDGGDAPCERTLPVFDGKQRYDLRMEPIAYEEVDTRGYEGMAWHCNIYIVPISGYDPEDKPSPEQSARPMEVWLADLGEGRWPPVLARRRVGAVTMKVEATHVSLQSGGPQRAESDGSRPDRG
jgi:hypothetical protein